MEKGSVSDLLTSVDSLFTTEKERSEANREFVINVPLENLLIFDIIKVAHIAFCKVVNKIIPHKIYPPPKIHFLLNVFQNFHKK